MAQIISGVEFNPVDDIQYAKAKVNTNGLKQIGIQNKKSKKSMYLSTPLMLTWGMNEYTDDKTGSKSYDMALQFPNDEYSNPECVEFLKNMQNFEQKLKADATENCKEWLNKTKMSSDVIDALWTPMLRYPKDKETGEYDYSRAPTLKVKIPYWEGNFKGVELYDDEQKQLFPNDDDIQPIEYVTKGSNVATIIYCGGIWVANGKFGVTWKLFQAVVKPRASLAGKCHISLSQKDKEAMNASVKKDDSDDELDTTTVGNSNETVVEDSDEEEPVVAVAAKEVKEEIESKKVTTEDTPKKKRVVKKKSAE